jgi:hypothetical protein
MRGIGEKQQGVSSRDTVSVGAQTNGSVGRVQVDSPSASKQASKQASKRASWLVTEAALVGALIGCADVPGSETSGIQAREADAAGMDVSAPSLPESSVPASEPSTPSVRHELRRVRRTASARLSAEAAIPGQIVLKLLDGSMLRARDGRVVTDAAARTSDDDERLTFMGLEPANLARESEQLRRMLARWPGLRIEPLFLPSPERRNLQRIAETRRGHWLAMFVRPSITAQMIRFIRGNYREFCRNQ